MMKNVLALKKGNRLDKKTVFDVLFAIAYGLCADQRVLVLFIVHLYSIYKKGNGSYILFSLLTCIFSLYLNTKVAMIYAMLCVVFFFMAKVYDAFHYTLEKHLFVWNGMLTLLSAYLLYGDSIQTYILTAMSVVLSFAFTYFVSEKENVFSYLSIAYLFLIHYYGQYALYIELAYISFCAYILPLKITAIVLFYFTILGLPPLYGMYLLIVAMNPTHKLILSLCSWLTLFYDFELIHIFFATLCSLLAMFAYESKEMFMEKSEAIEKEHRLYMEHSFYKQIVNYATVFYNLSLYYADRSEEQSEMLKRMGEALEYNARISKQYVYTQSELSTRICELLNGYHFDIQECDVKEIQEKMQIHLELEHLYENEIEEVVIPLLEKTCESKLRITKFKAYPFHKGKYQVSLESESYPIITTYGNSVHVHEVSGDTFHSFDMNPHVILMLSDGMGKGLKAKKTSTILIQIMEAMMRCHIPQMECIKMMNLFLRSDLYATLDVLSFDRRNNKAYLSKAASAPTYLLRKQELYEMNAHSLPIGIVDQVNADVYEITYQKGDIFIMCSDGVYKEEIEKWMKLRRCTAIKNDGLNLINIIKEKKRRDDSTILLAKID